jgi:hypothetical protein
MGEEIAWNQGEGRIASKERIKASAGKKITQNSLLFHSFIVRIFLNIVLLALYYIIWVSMPAYENNEEYVLVLYIFDCKKVFC